jgi:diguanylate cyclase
MPRRLPQPDLRVPSSERLGELIGHLTEGLVGLNGQTLSGTAGLAPDRSCIARPARPEELQRLLGASSAENRHLTAHVRRLEAELRRSAAELGKLRGELRGAVHDALTDPLTGLANRRAFDLELGAVGARASRSSPAHLVMVDIDHFKRVNDAHGHDIGDEVLRIVGEVLLANVRRDSVVARVGGDEFGLLLPGASPHYTAGIAIRLCELLASRPLVVRGLREAVERITLSIGVAAWQAGDGSAGWYARADAALYRAKRSGRNRVSIARIDRRLVRAEPATN